MYKHEAQALLDQRAQQVEGIRSALASCGALELYGSFTYLDAANTLYNAGIRIEEPKTLLEQHRGKQ